ncbi:PREDICTED: uncharacterized protein LOC108558759 [Nicrophorus vespilloides]|uniref:Uncharacterized protein LOC108558759 n=1 Tax=Nicrophorus vespilloides TaxID=110193 RepID=A0ABM1M9L3_NICVS|nr:PREDICTED: uncharacterized protein LOC108558759 [Nicrophorus vespilloides]
MMRRHPVTVRTPRYVRRPIAAVYKRPSALCLPLACQPDPASYRRYKHTVYTHQPQQQPQLQQLEAQKIVRRHSLPTSVSTTTAPHPPSQSPPFTAKAAKKSESKKSIDMTKSRLDAILERYEKIFGKNNNNNANDGSGRTEDANAADQQLLKHLKPRLPPSLKEKSIRRSSESVQSITRQQIPEIMKTAETFEVEEISSDVLDELLSELTENGLNDVINDDDKRRVRQHQSQHQTTKGRRIGSVTSMVRNKISQTELMPEKDAPKSFNYQEIKESISKCYTSESEDGGSRRTTTAAAIKPIALKEMGDAKNRRNAAAMMMMANEDVLELHRTKSYVVNLIDTALSSHFGTNISEKNPNKNMDPRNAVEMLKKQSSGRMDKDLCLEIAQALTDSFAAPGNSTSASTTTSAATAVAAAVSSSSASAVENKGSQCSCKSQLDEPTFVKQLKQMRWGHLKHIQREVRRLEELERFLDSCSVAPLEKYHG